MGSKLTKEIKYRQYCRTALFEVILVFYLLTLNILVTLVFGLANYLVWLGEERLNSFISRRSRDHRLKCYNVELKTAL